MSMASWQVMNCGFMRMSTKINSSRLNGRFKLSQIQQKLLGHEAFPNKWSLVFFLEKLDTSRITKNSQYWVVQNHLFASCLPRKPGKPTAEDGSLFTTSYTIAFLSTQNINLMIHPPCSPDLAANNYVLFPYVRNKMGGQRFSTPEEAVDAFRIRVSEKPQSEWQNYAHAKLYRS